MGNKKNTLKIAIAVSIASVFIGAISIVVPAIITKNNHDRMIEEAKTIFTQYTSENNADADYYVCEVEDGYFVAIKKGNPLDIYESAEKALKSMVPDANSLLLYEVGEGNLWSYKEPIFLADVYMIPCYGQSLSVNTSAGASTFAYVEPLSYDVNLKNNNIQDMCAGTAEAFSLMAEELDIELPEDFKIISCTGGAGGMSIQQLSKGSTYYNNVINSVKTAKANCDKAGLSMIVPCFTWTQGEEDMRAGGNASSYGTGSFDPYKYKDRLKKLIDDFNTDIKAITGQTNDVLCVSYQVASHTTYARYPRIALQQQELAMEDNRMILAKVMYDLDYVTEGSGVQYQVHAPAKAYRNMGNMYGIAAFRASVLQQDPKWVHPIDYRLDGDKMYVKFEVPHKPLELDTILVNNLPDENYGFQVYKVDEQNGKNGTIELGETQIIDVEIYSEDTVLITFNQEPLESETLTYGINGDYWQNINGSTTITTGGEGADKITKSGKEYGSRGCLRDSQSIKNENMGAVYQDLYNWCAIFEIPFAN